MTDLPKPVDPFHPAEIEKAFPGYLSAMSLTRAYDKARAAIGGLDDALGAPDALPRMIENSAQFKAIVAESGTDDWSVEEIMTVQIAPVDFKTIRATLMWSAATPTKWRKKPPPMSTANGTAVLMINGYGSIVSMNLTGEISTEDEDEDD